MSDDEKDLFGGSSSDGNDTDDLIATAKKKQKPIAQKKRPSTRRKTSKRGARKHSDQDTIVPYKIQNGQEHFLLKIVSHMFRQQADMSTAHAMQLEQLSMEYKQNNHQSKVLIGSIAKDDINVTNDDTNVTHCNDLNDMKSPCNSNFESEEERRYRQDMLNLAKGSLEGIQNIHRTLDQLFPIIQKRIDRDDEFIYDAFGVPVCKKKDEDNVQIKEKESKKRDSTKPNASDSDSSSTSEIRLRSGAVLRSDSSYSSYSDESVEQEETHIIDA